MCHYSSHAIREMRDILYFNQDICFDTCHFLTRRIDFRVTRTASSSTVERSVSLC